MDPTSHHVEIIRRLKVTLLVISLTNSISTDRQLSSQGQVPSLALCIFRANLL